MLLTRNWKKELLLNSSTNSRRKAFARHVKILFIALVVSQFDTFAVCNFIRQGNKFESGVTGRSYYINHVFDCDSGVVYLIACKKCGLQYVGNTVTPFRLRFNNHKSSMMRYGRGQRVMGGQKLYVHFYTEGHEGLKDLEVQVIP